MSHAGASLSGSALVVADRLSFTYDRRGRAGAPTQTFALHEVSARIERGALVGILGPNGSGKTTLLRLMAGALTPTSGAVTLEGVDIRSFERRALARRAAVVPQETHLVFDYSVLDMVLMGRHPHLGALEVEGAEDLVIVREAMAATGTLAMEQRSFTTLSGGEKQRVVIASALAQLHGVRNRTGESGAVADGYGDLSSSVLLLDEPTASLDLAYQLEIAVLLKRLSRERGLTIIVSTHDLNLAASLCDDLILVRGGRALAAGPTERVLTPDAIARLYGVDAEVHASMTAGRLVVTPLRRRVEGAAETP